MNHITTPSPAILNVLRVALDRANMNHRATGFFEAEVEAAKEWVRAALASKPPAGEQKPVLIVTVTKESPNSITSDVKWLRDFPEGETPLYLGPQPEQVAQDREDAADYKWLVKALTSGDPIGELDRVFRHLDADTTPTPEEFTTCIRAARARGEGGG